MKLRQDLVIQISAALMLTSFAGLSASSHDHSSSNASQFSQFSLELLSTEAFIVATPIKSSGSEPEPQPRNILNGSFKVV
ncbi:MAG: hypothetical protein HC799_04025 [Limnothrix sp. RL_2_0]|nr:hypothetical protein [Limnothrix sp. RL_2_0]